MAYSPAKVTIEIDAVVDHVRLLQRDSELLEAVKLRAGRGLDFALRQQELTEGYPNAEYWHGKVDAYTAVLEEAFGLTAGSMSAKVEE